MRMSVLHRTLVLLTAGAAAVAGPACGDQEPTGPSPPAGAGAIADGLALAPESAERVWLNLEDVRVRLLPGVTPPAERARLDAAIRALEGTMASGHAARARALLHSLSGDVAALRERSPGGGAMASDLDAIALALAYVASQL